MNSVRWMIALLLVSGTLRAQSQTRSSSDQTVQIAAYLDTHAVSADDEQLARRILLLQLPQWGYQEYADLYKQAWQVNHALPSGARRFRILALGNAPDWSVIKTKEDFDDWRVRRVAFRGETEEDWAQVVIDNVLAKNESRSRSRSWRTVHQLRAGLKVCRGYCDPRLHQ